MEHLPDHSILLKSNSHSVGIYFMAAFATRLACATRLYLMLYTNHWKGLNGSGLTVGTPLLLVATWLVHLHGITCQSFIYSKLMFLNDLFLEFVPCTIFVGATYNRHLVGTCYFALCDE